MATTLYAVPLLDTLAKALSQAWARIGQRQFEPLARWQVLHIDQNGELQRATVDVLEAMPLERLILARFSPQDEPLVIQLGRIIEAIDMPTGRKVMLDRWMAHIEGQPGPTRPGGLPGLREPHSPGRSVSGAWAMAGRDSSRSFDTGARGKRGA